MGMHLEPSVENPSKNRIRNHIGKLLLETPRTLSGTLSATLLGTLSRTPEPCREPTLNLENTVSGTLNLTCRACWGKICWEGIRPHKEACREPAAPLRKPTRNPVPHIAKNLCLLQLGSEYKRLLTVAGSF